MALPPNSIDMGNGHYMTREVLTASLRAISEQTFEFVWPVELGIAKVGMRIGTKIGGENGVQITMEVIEVTDGKIKVRVKVPKESAE